MGSSFSEESLRRVREANDIVDVVGQRVELKRSGSAFKGLCPFHNEKTPSFQVNPTMQIYKCFGCGKGGDVFRFLMETQGLTFPEAVENLAERAGIQLERHGNTGENRQAADERTAMFQLMSRALAWFEERLADPAEGRVGREYLLGRAFTAETIKAWRLGWAPEGGRLAQYLASQTGDKWNYYLPLAIKAGLVRQGDDGRVYDFFRGRVMFPIHDPQGRPVAFGGRVLREDPEKKVGKYLNTPETPLFSKSHVLFGLDAASREMRNSRAAIVVEGYTDAIMCHQHGLRNVVATLGTALTEEHIRLLKRYAGVVVARFDADEAGERATERAVRLFSVADMPLKIVRSLEVKDACDYLPRMGAEAFRAELEKAEESFAYHMRRCLGKRDLRNLDEKAAAVREIMEVVNLSPDLLKREMLRQRVAAEAGVPVDALPQPQAKPERFGEGRGGQQQAGPAGSTQPRNAPGGKAGGGNTQAGAGTASPIASSLGARLVVERELLLYMLADGRWCERVCAELPPEDFGTAAHRSLASVLHDAWIGGVPFTAADIIPRLESQEAVDAVTDAVRREKGDLTEQRFSETLRRLRRLRLEEERGRQQEELIRAQAAGEAELVDSLIAAITALGREIDEMRRREQDAEAAA